MVNVIVKRVKFQQDCAPDLALMYKIDDKLTNERQTHDHRNS